MAVKRIKANGVFGSVFQRNQTAVILKFMGSMFRQCDNVDTHFHP